MDMSVMIKAFLEVTFPGVEPDEANCGKETLKKLESCSTTFYKAQQFCAKL